MMQGNENNITLGEAVNRYIDSLLPEETASSKSELQHFIRWFGRDKPVTVLLQEQVDKYIAGLPSSDVAQGKKLDQIHRFLVYAKKEKWSTADIPVKYRSKKNGKQLKAAAIKQSQSEVTMVTQDGYDAMQKELSELKERRPKVLEEIRRAAADKDFRENAPLHAAREQLGYIDGRIQELEATLKNVNVVGRSDDSKNRVSVGKKVILVEVDSGVEYCYTIVGAKESAPGAGKISYLSPIGKAILGRTCDEKVEVDAPSGKLYFCIKHIG
jgi:transcription elongation factor GreA